MRIYVGSADVKDCLHRMRMPEWMSRYFALPPVPARVLDLQGTLLNGQHLAPHSAVSPGWTVLPMVHLEPLLCPGGERQPSGDGRAEREPGTERSRTDFGDPAEPRADHGALRVCGQLGLP